jgi:alkyl hydroperoxide reductase subunit F
MLDEGLKTQLKAYLQNLRQPIALVASLGEGQGSKDMLALLEDVAGTSDKVSLNLAGDDARKPSFSVTRDAGDASVRFAGLPLGHEFTSLVLALLHVGGHPPKFDAEVLDRSAPWTATTTSRPISRSPARTAPTWCRRSTP